MKILAIHNFHRKGSASGDDQVFKSETALLEAHGHKVIRYSVSNDEFDKKNMIGKILSTFGMLWSIKNYRQVRMIIRDEKPDVVHVHTFFPLLSPAILYAAKKERIPVVATLHDTRFICPCATSLRGSSLCNKCKDGHYLRMCLYKCFKGSRLQSLIVAMIFKYHRIRKSFYKQIDKYICLNDSQIDLLIKTGFEKKKIVKKYNFIEDPDRIVDHNITESLPERYVVFYGRIGEEKGIRILMKMWDRINTIPLVVMGGGPLQEEFERWAKGKSNVYFLGYTERSKCLGIVKNAQFVVFPSIWYEGCSMVEIEAMALGKSIVATDLGFSSEAIENGYNGCKIPMGNLKAFVDTIKKLWNDPQKCRDMGDNARKDYIEKYTAENNYRQLIDIYEMLK